MHVQHHPITLANAQPSCLLSSFHFGEPGKGKKVYIQAALHADEIPGMLVAQFIRTRLVELEQRGCITGEIILVPQANPLGLAQAIHGAPFGRFDLSTGINFNREFRHVLRELKPVLEQTLTADENANRSIIRRHARAALQNWEVNNNAESLKKILLTMAIDADIVLDLHCDNEALLHLYTGTPLADAMQPLAAFLGVRAMLVAQTSGDEPFDEACSSLWWELQSHFADRFPVPLACLAATVELRGEKDLSYELARQDADAILAYLAHCGVIDLPRTNPPAPLCQPTPLAAVEPIRAPHDGILIFTSQLGDYLAASSALADLIDPVSGETTIVRNTMPGVFFARSAHTHVLRGMNLAKLAGSTPFRSGNLLSL